MVPTIPTVCAKLSMSENPIPSTIMQNHGLFIISIKKAIIKTRDVVIKLENKILLCMDIHMT